MSVFDKNFSASLLSWGFNQDCDTYVFLGNTYEKKDEIKSLGAKFEYSIGWHIDHDVEGYDTMLLKLSPDDFSTTKAGKIFGIKVSKSEIDKLKKEKEKELYPAKEKPESKSKFFGNVGDKIQIELTVDKVLHLSSAYGDSRMFIMHDDNENIFTWNTSTFTAVPSVINKKFGRIDDYHPLSEGDKVALSASIKSHKMYRDTEQTVLTRCKILHIYGVDVRYIE